jgi:hypothetical protein
LISNRQGGRRRGRGGGGRSPGAPNSGNRPDNRQRGNAAQLLEKYKGLARDAQMQGDRVQTEYYLQFADHYYRVLNESRARFEEQRRARGDDYGDEEEDGDDALAADGDERDESSDRYERAERNDRYERNDRERGDRDERRPRRERAPQPVAARPDEAGPAAANEEERPRRARGRRRFEANGADHDGGEGGERISADILPPAIGAAPAPVGDEGEAAVEAPAPRRRTRRPRAGDEEIAPAA